MKVHKATKETIYRAIDMHSKKGYWDPRKIKLEVVCGIGKPKRGNQEWDLVTCKRCLKKRKARK